MDVHFTRRADDGTIAEFSRHDGVRVRLRSYDRTGVVPHDLAHLVVEREMRLHTGLWGSLAAGAEFSSVELIAGRSRHDHKARSAAIRRDNDRALRMAELLVGAVLNQINGHPGNLDHELRAAWSIYRPNTAAPPSSAGETAVADLAQWAKRWNSLGIGEGLTLVWPDPNRRR